jgi:Tripartite tricarboxylate transporter TctB family
VTVSRRALELMTAALTGSFGAAVAISSMENGIGWSAEGVDAGTFPFLTGLIILLGSLYNIGRGLVEEGGALASAQLLHLAALFIPAALFVSLIPFIGLYAAAGAYMLGTLLLQSRRSLPASLAIALATPVALYLIFERMFQVSLPHGALAGMLGF